MRRNALPLIAGLVTFLTIASGGVAYALWSGTAEQSISASSAEMGVSMVGTDAAEGLALGYNEGDGRFANAGTVTITNNGTRDAWYSILATVEAQSAAGLQDKIRFGGHVVATVEDCAPTSAPSQTLASGSASLQSTELVPEQLAPGASVIVCLETWLPQADIAAFGSTYLDLAISSSLRYTAHDDEEVRQTWTTGSGLGEAVSVRQNVVTQDLALLFENPIGRYWVSNTYYDETTEQLVGLGTVCKAGGLEQPARHDGVIGPCTGDTWNSQWRLVPVPDQENVWWILRAVNSYTQPDTPRWTVTDLDSPIVNVAPDNDDPDQKWVIEGRGDGTYRIKAFTRTDANDQPICIATGGPMWAGLTTLVPATCSGQAVTQGFRFDLIGYPVPATRLDGNGAQLYPNGYPLACTGDQWWAAFSWMNSDMYEQETKLRLVAQNGGTVIHSFLQSGQNPPAIGFGPSNAATEAWYQAHGAGTTVSELTLVVEQQITELGSWAQVTEPRTVWVKHFGTNDNRIYCNGSPDPVPSPTPSPTGTEPPGPPPGPISFPSSWCTPTQGSYLQLHWPYANGSTWRVFLWKTGDAPIDPAGDTGRISFQNTWYSGGEPYVQLNFNGANSVQTWLDAHGGGTHTGVEVRVYRDLGGGSWEYYAMRPMTFSSSWPNMTCA